MDRPQTSRGATKRPEAGLSAQPSSRRASRLRDTSSRCFPWWVEPPSQQAPQRPAPDPRAVPLSEKGAAGAGSQTEKGREKAIESRLQEPVIFHVGTAMRSVLERRFREAEGSIAGALYCIDDAELVRALSKKARDKVEVRLVLDEG